MLFPDPGIGRRHRRTFSRADYGRRSAARPPRAYDFAVKIAQSDGLFPAKAGGAMANSAEVAFCGGYMLEAAVGTIASAHLFATFPSLAIGTELFGPLQLTEKILQGLGASRFRSDAPKAPGLGTALDDNAIAYFRRDKTTLRAINVVAGRTIGMR